MKVKNSLANAKFSGATQRHSDSLSAAVRRLLFANAAVVVGSSLLGFSSFAQAANTTTVSADDNLEEIVITARRRAILSATDRKKNSDTVIDSVVADDAGLLPDNSITEVLQRVSGVTMTRFAALNDPDHFSVEGSGIQVRGLSGVAGRLNGREIFSANGSGGLSWGDVTPELMSAVDVYKESTANLIEGGTGGQIDLHTKMPFDFEGLTLAGNVGVDYSDLVKKSDPSASFLFSDRWQTGIGEIGALVDVAYSKLDQISDFIRMEPYYKTALPDGSGGYKNYHIPGGFDYGFDQFSRTRTGVYVGLQWKPTDDLSIAQTAFYSRYATEDTGMGVFSTATPANWGQGDWGDGNGNVYHGPAALAVDPTTSTFDANGALVSSPSVFLRDPTTFNNVSSASGIAAGGNTHYDKGDHWTRDLSTSFDWKATDRLSLKGAVQFLNSEVYDRGYDIFPSMTFPGTYSLDLRGSLPQVSFSDTSALQNPSNYYFVTAHMPAMTDNQAKEHALNLDVNYALSENGFLRSAQAGLRYAKRTETDAQYFAWADVCESWDGCPNYAPGYVAQPGDMQLQNFDDFFRGKTNLPSGVLMPSLNLVRALDPSGVVATYNPNPNRNASPCQLAHEAWTFCNNTGGVTDPYSQESVNTAGYAMVFFASDGGTMPFDGNAGVRVVRVKNTSTGPYSETNGSGTYTTIENGSVGAVTLPSFTGIRSDGRTLTRGLPAINVRFKPTKEFQVRLAYTVTLDQPNFYDLRASGSASPVTQTVTYTDSNGAVQTVSNVFTGQYTSSTGNPKLAPQVSTNRDIDLEWYPSASTSAHLSLFDKVIDDYFVYQTTSKPIQVLNADGSLFAYYNGTDSEVANSSEAAKIKGAEIGAKTFFDKLPWPFNGLGVEANYTYIDSHAAGDLYYDIDGNTHNDAPVRGLSRNSYNIQLMYEHKMVSARLAWNWRSKYLMTTDANGTRNTYAYFPHPTTTTVESIYFDLPIYGDAYGELDFGVTVRPIENVSIALEFNNLLNETGKTLMGGYPNAATGAYDQTLVRSWFATDRRASLTLGYKF